MTFMIDSRCTMRQQAKVGMFVCNVGKILILKYVIPLFEKVIASVMEIKWCIA